ncbi:MAG: hypothetical protein L0211_18920 [Planctomycetaceae bacterium]|nr:hypothetical protein [Planctomycetaceae bacterium]
MHWLDSALDQLARRPICGYEGDASPATEPTALAALALVANYRSASASPAISWLARTQAEDGSVGIREGQSPGWPTSLAVLAWKAANSAEHRDRIERAAAWILAAHGKTMPCVPEFGHNSEIPGWSYADDTSCWLEPTALAVLALKATGHAQHERTRDGVRLIIDRLLESGGCNYGNTAVLGQTLRPHIQPTGIALLALAGESDPSGRFAKSIAWLRRSIGAETPSASLAWALLGLRAHAVQVREANAWLAAAYERTKKSGNAPHKLALLALAAKGWPR